MEGTMYKTKKENSEIKPRVGTDSGMRNILQTIRQNGSIKIIAKA